MSIICPKFNNTTKTKNTKSHKKLTQKTQTNIKKAQNRQKKNVKKDTQKKNTWFSFPCRTPEEAPTDRVEESGRKKA